MAAFIDVLLRGLALCSQAVAVGGVIFVFAVLLPLGLEPARRVVALARALTLTAVAAVVLAGAQLGALAVQMTVLVEEGPWPVGAVLGTTYAWASLARIAAGVILVAACLAIRRRERGRAAWLALLGAAVLAAAAAPWTSHAAARLEHRTLLSMLDALHQLAAAAWIGGLVQLIVMGWRRGEAPLGLLQRFSRLALAAVATLVITGATLTLAYVDGLRALLGTSYGIMVLTKMTLLAVLLVFGALNFFAVRRLGLSPSVTHTRVRRFVEVEFGVGLTVLFVAASLTSLPPAVDVVADRATFAEVATRFTPRWPTLTSPAHAELPVDDRAAPRTDEDRAWSEYNHHMAGLFVLTMGVLALLSRSGWAPWARHWPLVFLALASFLFVRNDPGAWPLGPLGFWESMVYPEVVQHRVFVMLVIVFGLFEWMVRSGRFRARAPALVFPILCAIGGGFLLTHSHAGANLKAEFLIEVTHAPLGVLGVMIGWARWLELRLPAGDETLPGRLWASGFTLFGILLLFYRES